MPTAEDLVAIDAALLGLRRLWVHDAVVQDPDVGRVDLSTVWVADAVARECALTVAGVAAALHVAHSTASRFVSRAERAGVVTRGRSDEDARQVRVCLTAAGADVARRARQVRLDVLHEATARWTESERGVFARLLADFAQSVPDAMTGPLVRDTLTGEVT